MEKLVKEGANVNYIAHKMDDYTTPLLWFISEETQNLPALRELLKLGANPNLITPDGKSPIYSSYDGG